MRGGRAMQQSRVVQEKEKANKALGIGSKKPTSTPAGPRKRKTVEPKSPKARRGSKGSDGSEIDLDSASDLFASSSEETEEAGFLDTLGEMGGGGGPVSPAA